MPLGLIALVFALVLFVIAAVWNPAPPSPWFGRLVAAGLAFLTVYFLLAGHVLR